MKSTTYLRALSAVVFAGVLFLALFFLPPSASAQNEPSGKTEVRITADSFVGREVDGQSVRELIGNVYLVQEDTQLWSDRAIQWIETDEIKFSGNVLLVEEGDSVRANSMLYNRQTKIGRADGNVELSDGEVLVNAPTAVYETESKYAIFSDGVTLEDSTSILKSLEGQYWSDDKRALFVGEVALSKESGILRADTVDYLRDTEVASASGNVIVEEFELDTLDVMQKYSVVFGSRSRSTPNDSTFSVSGNVLLMRLTRDSSGVMRDTLVVRSDQLEVQERAALDIVKATGQARIWSEKLRSSSTSMQYDSFVGKDITKVSLTGSPITWYDDAQMLGDTILFSQIGDLDSVWVNGNAFLARWDSATAKIHQVQAEKIVGGGRDSANVLTVYPNAEAIYFMSGDKSGGVRVTADQIVFHVAEGDLEKVDAVGGVEGTYYPEESIPTTFQLSKFVWRPEDEPSSDLFLGDLRYTAALPSLLVSQD